MRKWAMFALLTLGLSAGAGAQPTYRADVGIVSLNMESPDINPQASNIILKANASCDIVVKTQSNTDLLLGGYALTVYVDGRPVGQLKQDSLRSHESVTHKIHYVAKLPDGPHRLTAKIDPVPMASMPNEDDPSNNIFNINFLVEGATP